MGPVSVPAHPTSSGTVAEAPAGPAAQAGDRSLPCPACGYDLRRLAPGHCPECGRAFTGDELCGVAHIPWQNRRQIGQWGAFNSTLWLALRHPQRLAQEISRDVDYGEARRFHLICCGLGWIALAPLLVLLLMDTRRVLMDGSSWFATTRAGAGTAAIPLVSRLLDVLVLAAALAGLFVWLITATGVMSYFFQPRDLDRRCQENAISISYYGAAPLALLPPATLLLLLAMTLRVLLIASTVLDAAVVNALLCAAVLVWLFVLVDLLLIPWILLIRGLRRPLGRPILLCAVALLAAPILFVVWVIAPAGFVLWLETLILTLAR
jgi:hypothetical protein